MSPTAARANRLLELTKIVVVLNKKGKTTDEIIDAVRERAHQMAGASTAEDYVSEIIRRFAK